MKTTMIRRLHSPKIEEAQGIISLRTRSDLSVKWGIINAFASLLFYCNLLQSLTEVFLQQTLDWISYADLSLAVIFFFNAITNLYYYVSPAIYKRHLAMSPKEKELLGIDKNDKNFPDTPLTNQSMRSSKSYSGSNRSSSWSAGPKRQQFCFTTAGGSPLENSSLHSLHRRSSFSPRKHLNYTQTESPSRTDLFSHLQHSNENLLKDTSLSPRQLSPVNKSSSRSLITEPSPIQRYVNQEDKIMDSDGLESFIQEQSQSFSQLNRDSPANQGVMKGSVVWNYGQIAYNMIPSFGSYQLAIRPSLSSTEDDNMSYYFDEIWSKIGITRESVDFWTENLKKWIAETILDKVVKEIQTINTTLTQIGCSEFQIGHTNINSLRGLSLSKSAYVPSLNALLPYLDMGNNQEYIVERLKGLSAGGCLRLYRWDGGGKNKAKEWSIDLPTDAQIVMHLFNTYMDTQLPGNPLYPEGKSFSGMYYLKHSDKPDKISDIYIAQTRVHPPNFRVVADGATYEIPKGRNNLYHSIIIFLYFIKVLKLGMLERVNLGLSGINILWILNKK